MPILNLQKRQRELGRIRTGDKGAKGQPQKLTKFRLTSHSKVLLEKAATLYGGQVKAWTPAGGVPQWELYTEADRIPIMVPPQPVSQWWEVWSAGGCVHRCDGETDYITGDDCDPATSPHHQGRYAAKATTRLKVVLRDVEGVGVWRLESHGINAAMELPDAADFLAQAGGYVEGWLALEERITKSIKDGEAKTNRFLVPITEIDVTPAQLMAGLGRIQPPAIGGAAAPAVAAAPAAAIAAPVPDYLAQAQDASTLETVQVIWRTANAAGHMTDELNAQLKIIGDRFAPPPAAAAAVPDADGVVDAEVVDDEAAAAEADMVWQRVLAEAGRQGLTTTQTTEEYAAYSGGEMAGQAAAGQLEAFLVHLQGAGQQAASA